MTELIRCNYFAALLLGEIPFDFFLMADYGRLPSIDPTVFYICCTTICWLLLGI